MSVLVFDTGFLLSLAADNDYAAAVRIHWQDRELWVPSSVSDELRVRARFPRADIPPELPNRALGIIASASWNFTQVVATAVEDAEVRSLQERVGGPGSTHNAGECEATVLTVRDATAILATDDRSALPVLVRHVHDRTGRALQYVHTSTVIEELRSSDRITQTQLDRNSEAIGGKGSSAALTRARRRNRADCAPPRIWSAQSPGERTLTSLTRKFVRKRRFQAAARPRELAKWRDSKRNERLRVAYPQVSGVDEKWWRVHLYAGHCDATILTRTDAPSGRLQAADRPREGAFARYEVAERRDPTRAECSRERWPRRSHRDGSRCPAFGPTRQRDPLLARSGSRLGRDSTTQDQRSRHPGPHVRPGASTRS